MEANKQGQEEVEAQVIDAQGVIIPPHRLKRSKFKALGNNGRLFSLFIVSCNKRCLEGNIRHLFCKSISRP